jgi:hypothetical protein
VPTYYIDFEGGNDANTGLSFAQRWQTFTNGATAARIAPGDTIRVMASPDPTLVGNATWTDGPRPAAVAIASSTNATPIVITTSTAHGLVAGDYVTVINHSTNTNANGVWKVGTVSSSTQFQILEIDGTNTTGNGVGGASGTSQEATNCMVKLASAVTQNIALCGGLPDKPAWTASANVTATQGISSYKEGYSSATIIIAAGFTTGKAAYYTLPSTLNLSAFQQVSFWIFQNSGTIGAAGAAYLALCSDTLGNTVVNTINIPALGALSTWHPITVDLGTNLGASIQSVALYIVTDNGTQTFFIDNIIACKASSSADSLTLTSLVSKSSGSGDEAWYSIQSINGDAVMIGNSAGTISTSTNLRGYMGTTETVSTYKRQPIRQGPSATTTTTVNVFNDSGTAGNLIAYSGGWNRTDMSTQTGETWYDGVNGNGYCYVAVSTSVPTFISTDKLNAVRFNQGWRFAGVSNTNNTLLSGRFTGNTGATIVFTSDATLTGPIWANNNGGVGLSSASSGSNIGTVKTASNNGSSGIGYNGNSFINITTIDAAHNNVGSGLNLGSGSNGVIGSLTANGNTTYGIEATTGTNNRIGGGSTSGNGLGGFSITANGTIYLSNFTINESIEFVGTSSTLPGGLFSNRHDNTDNNSWVFNTWFTVNQQSVVVDSPATTAWKISPTNNNATALIPARLKLATVVCAASSLVTITARMQRDNTGLTMRLVCPGGQISGVNTDVTSDMTAAANTWETVTITFTPTKAGAVDIYAYAFGGTTFSGYVCNLTPSQA